MRDRLALIARRVLGDRIGPVRSAVRALRPSTRSRELEQRRAFRTFAQESAPALAIHIAVPSPRRRALVVNVGLQGIEPEILFGRALELVGYESVVLVGGDDWPARYYRAAGQERIVRWQAYLDAAATSGRSQARRLLSRLNSRQDLMSAVHRSARIGRITAATALRGMRIGSFDLSHDRVRERIGGYLARSISATEAAERILDEVRPELLVVVDRGYTPAGELFDTAVSRGVPVVTWNAAHRSNAIVVKRYTLSDRDVHFASLSERSWELVRTMPFGDRERDLIGRELEHLYASGDWFAEVGTQIDKRLADAAGVRQRLGIDLDKPTAAIFPHILWDGTFFWGTDLFDSYEEWLVETVRAAIAAPQLNWILKIHPAHLVKNARDDVRVQPAEIVALSRHLGELPPHIRVLPPDWDISTYSLYRALDTCFTVRGTVGIEAAALGVSVVTAGTGRYDRHGFTLDPGSREAYLNAVRNADRLPHPSIQQRDLAERFAFGSFLMRPLSLETVTFEFGRDARATARSRVVARTPADWQSARDVRALADWIAGTAEDYLDMSYVPSSAAKD